MRIIIINIYINMSKVTLSHLKLEYKKNRKEIVTVGDDLNATFDDAKVSVIIGASGCGKTTLLRAVAGILNPVSGKILFDETDVTNFEPGNRNISYVSQMIGLYPNLSVFNNIAFPLQVSHTPAEEIRERVQEVAEMLKIDFLLSRKPRELSIGQAQRVAIARAIVKRSIVYLFDEPFSNLDKNISRDLIAELRPLFIRLRATVIFVSHDTNEAFSIADQVYVMDKGKIIAQGEPMDILNSKDERIRRLIKG